MLSLNDVICTYSHKSKIIKSLTFMFLQGKYHIQKQKFAKCIPKCNLFFIRNGIFEKAKRMAYC